jgi:hypothetical protein
MHSIGKKSLKEMLQELSHKDPHAMLYSAANGPYYYASFLEDEFLYHATPWRNLKHILAEGRLTAKKSILKPLGIDPILPDVLCFTTSKWRHLSGMPDFSIVTGFISNDCYLKIPFDDLKGLVKPVIYKLGLPDIEDMISNNATHMFPRLCLDLKRLARENGIPARKMSYFINSIFCEENEWRILGDLQLPKTTQVYVPSKHKKRVAQQLTQLPICIDAEIARMFYSTTTTRSIHHKIRSVIGHDSIAKTIKQIEISKNQLRLDDGTVVKVMAVLRDVPAENVEEIERRLALAQLYAYPLKEHKPSKTTDVVVQLKTTGPTIGVLS